MEDSAVVIILTIIGSVASIVALFIAAPGKRSKIVHVIYALALTAVAGSAVAYRNELDASRRQVEEINRIEREAEAILKSSDRSTQGSMIGFILAILSFLEKYKIRFPDTYERATKVAESSGIYAADRNDMPHFDNLQEGASAMYFLLGGIAASNTSSR
jgi:hypothetical protein